MHYQFTENVLIDTAALFSFCMQWFIFCKLTIMLNSVVYLRGTLFVYEILSFYLAYIISFRFYRCIKSSIITSWLIVWGITTKLRLVSDILVLYSTRKMFLLLQVFLDHIYALVNGCFNVLAPDILITMEYLITQVFVSCFQTAIENTVASMQAVLSATLDHAVASCTSTPPPLPGTPQYTATLATLTKKHLELRLVHSLDAIRTPRPSIRSTHILSS